MTHEMDYQTATQTQCVERKNTFVATHSTHIRKSKTGNHLPGIWSCLYGIGNHSFFQQNFNASRKSPICVWNTINDWARAYGRVFFTTEKSPSYGMLGMWNFLGFGGASSYWNPFGNFWAVESLREYVSFSNDDGEKHASCWRIIWRRFRKWWEWEKGEKTKGV